MEVTVARPSSEYLLTAPSLSATQPTPKVRSLVPLNGRKSFTPQLGGCAPPQTPLKEWSATGALARITGSKSKTKSRAFLSKKRPGAKAQMYYTAPSDIADWTPVSGGPGVIDCWPLRPPGSHKPNRRPKLLEDLQRFRTQELARLHKSGVVPGEDRLQVSRECLDSITRNFKTYQPMLAEIKADYEQVLEGYERLANKVAPLEAELDEMRSQHNTSVLRTERDHESRIAAQESALEAAKQKVLSLESAVEHSKNYREECSRKMAAVDEQLTHLQVLLSFQAKNALHVNAINKTTQEELRDAHSQVAQLQRSQGLLKREIKMMVPTSKLQSSEMARLNAENKLQAAIERVRVLEHSNAGLQQAYDTISSEHSAIKEMYMHLVGSLELPNELNDSITSSVLTPRPEWSQAEGAIEGKLSGSTSQRVRQLKDLLRESQDEMAFLRLQTDCECSFWQPIVAANDRIPHRLTELLIFDQPVRNLHLTMAQVEERVTELWAGKYGEADDNLKSLSMEAFITQSFQKKNTPTANRAELMYNLFHGLCVWGGASAELQLFRKVLEGRTEDTVYFATDDLIVQVAAAAAQRRDAADRDLLSLEDVRIAVNTIAPVKSVADAQALGYVLNTGVLAMGGWTELMESNLSGFDPEPQIEPYRKLLRAQALKERNEYLMQLRSQLEKVAYAAFVKDKQQQAAEIKQKLSEKLKEHEEMEQAVLFGGTESRPATPMTKDQVAIQAKALEALKSELESADERIAGLNGAKPGNVVLGLPPGGWGGATVTLEEYKARLIAMDPDFPPMDLKTLCTRLYGHDGFVVKLSEAMACLEAHPLQRHSVGVIK